mmetsp:Transcript_16484/g.38681  ORF Transcript_16484/g.38681 Transcript_16484/m.38681 type:complete len:244 (-) Transcript_16484:1059-1790(-)
MSHLRLGPHALPFLQASASAAPPQRWRNPLQLSPPQGLLCPLLEACLLQAHPPSVSPPPALGASPAPAATLKLSAALLPAAPWQQLPLAFAAAPAPAAVPQLAVSLTHALLPASVPPQRRLRQLPSVSASHRAPSAAQHSAAAHWMRGAQPLASSAQPTPAAVPQLAASLHPPLSELQRHRQLRLQEMHLLLLSSPAAHRSPAAAQCAGPIERCMRDPQPSLSQRQLLLPSTPRKHPRLPSEI